MNALACHSPTQYNSVKTAQPKTKMTIIPCWSKETIFAIYFWPSVQSKWFFSFLCLQELWNSKKSQTILNTKGTHAHPDTFTTGMHSYTCIHSNKHIHTRTHSHAQMCAHMHIHTQRVLLHTYTHPYILILAQRHINILPHTCTHTHMHTWNRLMLTHTFNNIYNACTYLYMHPLMFTPTHTFTDTLTHHSLAAVLSDEY